MAAAAADVLGPPATNPADGDEVAEQHARRRVPDHREPGLRFDEGVPAPARVLGRRRSRRDDVDTMAEEAARVADSLLELTAGGAAG